MITTQVLQFVELSEANRKNTERLGKLGKGDRVEVRITRQAGADQTLSLLPEAAALLDTLLGHLLQGDRVAILTDDQELSPNDSATILVPYRSTLDTSCVKESHQINAGMMVASVRRAAAAVAARPALVR